MSNRSFRKELEKQSQNDVKTESESELSGSSNEENSSQINKFALLAVSHSSSDEQDFGPPPIVYQATDVVRPKQLKKKKRKNVKHEITHKEELDPLDKEIVDKIKKDMVNDRKAREARSVISIEYRHLLPENELKRMFGSAVINSERNKKNMHLKKQKTFRLVTPASNWPPFVGVGMSMEVVSRGDINFFKFVHNREYQKVQREVMSGDHNVINHLAMSGAYNIDLLLQMSYLFRENGDTAAAVDLINRALFAFESVFHHSFNYSQANCRLQYSIRENRSFFICLFLHIQDVARKSCPRTALELTKFLFSLSPDRDPLASLLLLDYYTLRSSQYQFLVDFYHHFEPYRNLSQLPNFAYSLALAHFHLSKDDDLSIANKYIRQALLHFPQLLRMLLDKCGIAADKRVQSHSFFTTPIESKALKQLYVIYIERSYLVWKEPNVLPWLEKAVHQFLDDLEEKNISVADGKKRRETMYPATPLNIQRHIFLSDFSSSDLELQLTESGVGSVFDPFPPADSIAAYAVPSPTEPRSLYHDANPLAAFFQTLLPTPLEQGDNDDNNDIPRGFSTNLMNAVVSATEGLQQLMDAFRRPNPVDDEDHNVDENGE